MTTDTIRFGLNAVADVSADVARQIAAGAPYVSLPDLLARCPTLGIQAATSLIAAGGLDSLYSASSRGALIAALPSALAVTASARALQAVGQGPAATLLAGFHVETSEEGWDPAETLAAEHAALGLYLSGHPIDAYDTADYCSPGEVMAELDGQTVVIAGLVTSIDRKISKAGNHYSIMVLEDRAASIETVWFSSALDQPYADLIGRVIAVEGKVSARDDRVSLIGRLVKDLPETGPEPVIMTVNAAELDIDQVVTWRASLSGTRPVHLVLVHGERTMTLGVSRMLR